MWSLVAGLASAETQHIRQTLVGTNYILGATQRRLASCCVSLLWWRGFHLLDLLRYTAFLVFVFPLNLIQIILILSCPPQVGKILYRQSASTVKRLGLELGGNAAFIVFESAGGRHT